MAVLGVHTTAPPLPMRRRTILGGLAGIATLSGAAWWLVRGADGDRIEPREYELLYAGPEASTVTLPDPDRVTVLEFFATSCDVCQGMMPTLGEVADTIDPTAVQFVSVTIEPLGLTIGEDDVLDWWETYDGHWAMTSDHAHDRHLSEALEVTRIPRTVVLDEGNRVVEDTLGAHSADELLAMIEAANS